MSVHRLAIVTPNFHPATCGVGDNAMRIAEEVTRRGHCAIVMAGPPVDTHPDGPSVAVRAIDARSPFLRALRARDAIDVWKADHVLIQYVPRAFRASRFGTFAPALLANALSRRGVPVTVLVHEPFVHWAQRLDLAAAAVLQRAQLTALLAVADDVVVTTESRVALLEPWTRAAGRGTSVRLVPIAPGALPVPARRRKGRLRIGVFSMLGYGRRFDVVLDAFERVARVHPHAELVLLGDVSGERDRSHRGLEERIRTSPMARSIRLTGKLGLAEVAQQIADLDVYLFPVDTGANTRSSTLPIPLGSGVPVVATRGIETGQMFRDDENIVMADRLDAESFARAVLRVVDDAALAARVRDGGRKLYAERLAWPIVVDALFGARFAPVAPLEMTSR